MDNKNADATVKVETPPTIDNKDVEQEKQSSEAPVKKSTKEERSRKKDDKSVEQVLKALNSLETTEEKLAAMCKKYSDIVDENRRLQLTVKQTEKRLSMVQREKEQLQTEHSKAVLTRSRLESLCRELQRQNKAIKDESLLKIREEEEKRKEVSTKFQSTLNEITALMQQNNEKNSKLREDNLEMTKKFKTLCEQYELREQHVEKITKHMQLEAQLADAKLSKAKMEMAAEKETLLKEKQGLLMELAEYQSKCQELQTTEINLRSQINLYTDKYDEFQNALSRSNEVFGGFKGEMEKMSKKICKLEKETSSWKQRWEKSHQALLEMAADKQQRDCELSLACRQLAQLQKLCRTLQAERTSLLAQLRTEGAHKDGVSTMKISAPVEVPQSLVEDPVSVELCRNESQEDCTSTQTEIDTCQNANLPVDVTENMTCLNPENVPMFIIAAQTQDLENVTTNPISSTECLNEISQNIESEIQVVNSEIIVNADDSLVTRKALSSVETCPEEASPASPSEMSDILIPNAQLTATDNVPHIQDEAKSIESVKETAIIASPSSEHISLNDTEPVKEDVSLVNGEIPALDVSETTNTLSEDLPKSNTTYHTAENGVVDQPPVKTSPPAESKKGKEGGKKRKNK